MRAGWRCPCVSLAILLTYVVGSLLFLCPPLDPVGTSASWGPRIRSMPDVDSIVFVALGPAARSASLLYALASLREEGHWDGPVHVIVEHEDALDCLSSYLRQPVTIVVASGAGSGAVTDGGSVGAGAGAGAGLGAGVAVEGSGGVGVGVDVGVDAGVGVSDGVGDRNMGVVVNAKMVKMRLFDLLPPSVERVVYVDCDVITQRPLGAFLAAIGREWGQVDSAAAAATAAAAAAAATVEGGSTVERHPAPSPPVSLRPHKGRGMEGLSSVPTSTSNGVVGSSASGPSTLLIFPDAGGHTVPVCSGCDMAHSGVVALARGRSELCLQLWHDAFLGGGDGGAGTATDQEALDIALREGSGCEARWIDRHHLHFMKDPFVMAGLTRTSTFAHFTGLLHPERLSKHHRRHYEWFLGRSFEEWGKGEIRTCAAE